MNTITVKTSSEYNVFVGHGLLKQIGSYIKNVSRATKIAIISDSNVWPLYGETVTNQLNLSGFNHIITFVFPAGEQSKNGEMFLSALEFLAQNQITRSDCIVALGGGVVGDLAGFTAASFLRGIDYIQIPTTLLACVDSSVGGKTAIDLRAGKNLAGAFYQPKLVICDIDTLSTLPAHVFRDGCAEVIKYAVLYDEELFDHLVTYGPAFDREWVISRCISHKRDVVNLDEFDRGDRQKLNLGHTFGHGIEASSNFTVSHGEAVAIGMAIVSRAGRKYGICSKDVTDRLLSILEKFELPTNTDYSADAIFQTALSDKKRFGNTVNLIIPRSIGDCVIYPLPVNDTLAFIEAGL